jgi:hypothetical protein
MGSMGHLRRRSAPRRCRVVKLAAMLSWQVASLDESDHFSVIGPRSGAMLIWHCNSVFAIELHGWTSKDIWIGNKDPDDAVLAVPVIVRYHGTRLEARHRIRGKGLTHLQLVSFVHRPSSRCLLRIQAMHGERHEQQTPATSQSGSSSPSGQGPSRLVTGRIADTPKRQGTDFRSGIRIT